MGGQSNVNAALQAHPVLFAKRRLPGILALLLFILCSPAQALKLNSMQAASGFSSAKAEYWRYEFVELSLDAAGADFSPEKFPVLSVRIMHAGKPAMSFSGKEGMALFYDANTKSWHGKWPLFWNPPLGDYSAELMRPDASAPESQIYGGPGGISRFTPAPRRCWPALLLKSKAALRWSCPRAFAP